MATVISFGAGVQSSALYVMSVLGLHGCPKADFAVFADVGDEPPWVYEQVERMRMWGGHQIPIYTATAGTLSVETLRRKRGERRSVASIPAFVKKPNKPGMLPRQCTRDFKIRPIHRKIKEVLGLRPRQRVRGQVTQLLGISIDEADRMKPSQVPWVVTAHPLIDAGLSRQDCIDLVAAQGLPIPKKSACVFCPYHDDAFWQDLKQHHPNVFARAVAFDEAIRDLSGSRIKYPVYLHSSLIPLRDVTFTDRRAGWSNECEGHCGV